MNCKDAMDEATRRAVANNEQIDVWFNADDPTLDWRQRYMACRYIDRPAHGRLACIAQPDGTFFTPTQESRAKEARPLLVHQKLALPIADVVGYTDIPYIDEPYTNYQAVARLAQHCAVVLTKLDVPHLWNWTGIEEDLWSKPSGLQDEAGFKIDLKYSEHNKRLVASADFGKLVRHRGRDDDHCEATYSPTRPARVIAADVVRRVIKPGRVFHARYLADEQQRQAKINRAVDMQSQIIAASRGAFEQSRSDDPASGEDLHLYLNASRTSLHCSGRISTWSNSVTLERLEVPFDLMLRLAAMIGDVAEQHSEPTEE